MSTKIEDGNLLLILLLFQVEFALVQGSGPLYMTGTTTLIDVDTERLAVLGDEDFEDDGEDNDENDDDDGEDGSDGDNISNSIDELTNELLAGISDSDSQDLKMSKKGMQLLRYSYETA